MGVFGWACDESNVTKDGWLLGQQQEKWWARLGAGSGWRWRWVMDRRQDPVLNKRIVKICQRVKLPSRSSLLSLNAHFPFCPVGVATALNYEVNNACVVSCMWKGWWGTGRSKVIVGVANKPKNWAILDKWLHFDHNPVPRDWIYFEEVEQVCESESFYFFF